jgi:hypothetical protein
MAPRRGLATIAVGALAAPRALAPGLVLVTLILGCFVGAPSAEGRRVALTHPRNDLAQGPALAGEAAVWQEHLCHNDCALGYSEDVHAFQIRLARTRGQPRLLARGEINNDFRFSASNTFAVSRKWLALGREESTSYGTSRRSASVRVGRIGEPRATVLGCSVSEVFVFAPRLGLSDELLAYEADPCDKQARLAVRSLETGATRVFGEPENTYFGDIEVAGPYVGVVRRPTADGIPDQIVVLEAATGKEVLAVPAPSGRSVHDLALADDGRVAVTTFAGDTTCGKGALSWYSPGEPFEHRLDGRPCGDVRMAGGEAAVVERTRRGYALKLVGLSGGTRYLLRPSAVRPRGFDVDVRMATYALSECDGRWGIFLRRFTGRASSIRSVRCRAALRPRTLREDRVGRVAVPLRCPRGCHGSVTIRRGRRNLAVAEAYVSVRRGQRRAPRVELEEGPRRGARWRVRVAFENRDRADRPRPVIRRLVVAG